MTHILDWLNEPLWRVRRIDPLIGVLGLGIAAYYWVTAGWFMAIEGIAIYAFVAFTVGWLATGEDRHD